MPVMTDEEELRGLRCLWEALTLRGMRIIDNGADVTERQIEMLKPDIAFLERCLNWKRPS
jgi:hypothetical protein